MREFASVYSYQDFELTVRRRTRYFYDEEVRINMPKILRSAAPNTNADEELRRNR